MSANDGYDHASLKGISGWLIFPTIATFATPLATVKDLYETVSAVNTVPVWSAELNVLMAFAAVAYVVQFGVQAYAIRCWFKRSSDFPLAFIAVGIAAIMTWLIGRILLPFSWGRSVVLDPELAGELTRNLIFLIIWVPYMLVSKRVKANFVN